MSKSSAKRGVDPSVVGLPFPHPIVTNDGYIVWPFGRNSFPLFLGKINCKQKWVEICDSNAMKAIQCFGFFGFHSKTRFVANETPKTECPNDSSKCPENQIKSRFDSKFSNGKYSMASTSVPMASSFCAEKVSDPFLSSESIESGESSKSCDQTTNDSKVLKLSFLESFFISYVFGSLNVLNTETNEYMTIDRMWETFGRNYSEDKLEFAAHYSAYHYFRSKGWVVRNGHSFGTNFLLYKEGPHLYHALYSVLVRYSVNHCYNKPLDWYLMSALIRLSKNVRKELIICVINIPNNCDISSPKCIQDFEVELLSFDRWNLTKGLAEQTESHHK